MSKNIFITGTGTDTGKTFITGLVLKKLRGNGRNAAYYKAAMSGNERRKDGSLIPGDALEVQTISGISQPLEEMCPFVYETAVSPHLASRIEGHPVVMKKVLNKFREVSRKYDYVAVEGSGGIICPLLFEEDKILLEDFILAGNFNCLIVADAGLGTINSVVLTAEYMKAHGIKAAGIIFNYWEPGNMLHEDNRLMCEALTGIKVIACVRSGDEELDISPEELEALFGEDDEIK